MNKNIVIGILAVAVVVGFGFYFSRNKEIVTPENNITPTEQPVSQSAPVLKPDAPIVQTSQSAAVSNSTAALTGTVKPNGASTTYWFEYGESTALGNRNTAQAIGSGYYSTPAPGFISGLRANTLYYYRLSAKNKFATVNGAVHTLQTNQNPPPKVVAPTVRTSGATDISRTTATVNGQVNPNGTATSYWYEYGTDTDFGYVTQFLGANSGTSFMSVPVSISLLEPLTKYYFRLNAQNQFGTVSGAIMNFTTTGPSTSNKPTVETSNAANISSSDATFVGRINPNGTDTTYWFEYSNDSLLGSLIGNGTPRGTVMATITSQVVKINVNELQSNTKYYYRLVGKNQNGTVSGDIVSFTTKK